MTQDESDPLSQSPNSLGSDAQHGESDPRIAHPSHSLPRWLRAIHLAGGFACLALGVLGIFLPFLPTTPLVLLAGYLFARGSERAHNWLLNHRVFGKIISEWQDHRRISARAKRIAIAMVLVSFAGSMIFVPNCAYGYVFLSVIGVALVVFLSSLPTTPNTVCRETE